MLNAALDYRSRGWAVIDLPDASKVPGRQGWQKERFDEDALRERLSAGPRNVSILFGKPSGGLVDLDLDCAEARTLATEFLPETAAVFGRAGSRGSHRLFVADPVPRYEMFADPEEPNEDRAVLVELRSGGQHSLVPPSRHPTGQAITWERDGEPASVADDDLTRRASTLAAASLLARHWNKKGQRNRQALALLGGLTGSGWEAEDAARFVESVARVGRDEEWRDRGNAAEATAGKQAEEEPTTGWPRLAELMGEKIVGRAREWLGLVEERGASQKEQKASQADLLVELAAAAYLFRDPGGEAYATISASGHNESHRLNTKGFKNWLRYQFYLHYGKAPGSQAVTDALGTLEGKARFDSPEHEVHVRLASHDGRVYLDLANDAWEAVEITKDGRRIIPSQEVPVRFRRAAGMRPLPYPAADGDLSGLRRLLNLPDDDEKSWVLIAAWLAAALRPTGPYPILILQGQQGSAKTTAQKLLRALVDPSTVPLRAAPREERDLMIAANNGHCVAFDNLSGVPAWLSDALCRLATGGGFGTRALYTDQEEVLFAATRPCMLNGITDVAGRPDLLDRSLVVELPVIPEEGRKTEREIWAEFGEEHPKVLGALLDAVSAALRRLPEVRLEKLPRMAEFAEWAVAAEKGLGFREGAFLAAYAVARSDAVGQALENDPVAEAVLAYMADRRQWVGTATELHKRLAAKVDEDVRRSKAWKKTPQHLSAHLKRLAPPLRAVGLEYTPDAGRTGPREPHRKRLRWLDGNGPDEGRTASSTSSTPSTQGQEDATDGAPGVDGAGSVDDGDGGVDDGGTAMDDTRASAGPRADAAVDGVDAMDGPLHARSSGRASTEAEVRAVLREPPGWLQLVLENYRDEYARPDQVDGTKVVWRVDLRTVANNVAAALGLSPTDGERIRPLVEEALAQSEYARDAST